MKYESLVSALYLIKCCLSNIDNIPNTVQIRIDNYIREFEEELKSEESTDT